MTSIAKLLAAGAVLGTLGIAGAVAAHDGRMGGPGPRGLDIASLDTDGDGAVSRAEMTAAGTTRLAAADTDGNGRLDRDELIASMPERPALVDIFGPDRAAAMADRMIARFGTGETGDFAIATMVESRVGDVFARLDADNSDTITADELENVRGRHAGRGDFERGQGPRGDGGRGQGWRHD